MHRPSWFQDDKVFISYAPTVGINKDGEELFVIDPETGRRTEKINDQVLEDVKTLIDKNETTPTSRWVASSELGERLQAVPVYYDDRPLGEFENLLQSKEFQGFTSASLGELIDNGQIIARHGHGSPSADLRSGTIPYIKVSDLRAGQVNINPTNRVTQVVAENYWRGTSSGLYEFDLLTPLRTSKNIGDFAVLMPGQERLVLTKEILVLHAAEAAPFDNFFLLWAMSLRTVRRQWDRVVFMQTNREDVGLRYRDIRIPVAPNVERALEISQPFREYYLGVNELRKNFLEHLKESDKFHIFLSSVESVEAEFDEEAAVAIDAKERL